MKRLFLVLAIFCCSFLYAETYSIRDKMLFNTKESLNLFDYSSSHITSILPYQNGYVVKLEDSKIGNIDFYITKGTVFYIAITVDWDVTYYKCTVTDIKPNEFTVKREEIVDTE